MSLLRSFRVLALLFVGASCGQAPAQTLPAPAPAPAPARGQLLYDTHCIECHNSQMHWRDRKLASDWASLKAQVTHWQAVALLNWSEADIVEVTRHLNGAIYRFQPPPELRGQAAPLPARSVAGLP
jgi:mono/diheme cytochrome c family protein